MVQEGLFLTLMKKNMHIKSVYDNSYYFQKYIHTSIQINDLLKEI